MKLGAYLSKFLIFTKKNLDILHLVKLIMYVLPVLAIIGVYGPLVLGLSNFSLLGLYLALPMVLGPFIYIVVFRRQSGLDDLG